MDLLEWSSRYLRLTLGYLGVAPSQQQLHRLSVYLYWGFLPSIKSLGVSSARHKNPRCDVRPFKICKSQVQPGQQFSAINSRQNQNQCLVGSGSRYRFELGFV
jgi:hypothetical protein